MMNLTMSSGQQPDSCDYHQVAWQSTARSNCSNIHDDVYYPPPRQSHIYPGCYGLPYQDHNYGAPPPPTPPLSPTPMVPISPPKLNGLINVVDDVKDAKLATITDTINEVLSSPSPKDELLVGAHVVPALAAEEVVDNSATDDSVTRCICDFTHDDGYMICCDQCLVWQHIDCVGINRECIPDSYYCEQCQPRDIDKKRAVLLQERRREQILAFTMKQKRGPKKGKKLKDKQQLVKPVNLNPKKMKDKKFQKKMIIKNAAGHKWVKEKNDLDLRIKDVIPVSAIKTIKVPKKIKKLKENDSPKNELKKISPKISKVSVTDEDALPPWDIEEDDCSEDSYEIVSSNMYSGAILEMFAGNKRYNGVKQHPDANNDCSPFDQLLVQLCKVRPNRKGIEVAHDVVSDQMVIEYKGEVMFREQFDKENVFHKNGQHPYVLFYSKYDRCELCIDATKFGSEARFLRRSCTPNAEVRHVVDSGLIHLLIYACKEISKGAEVTIPFDFDYRQCLEPVECACSRVNCAVTKFFKNRDQAIKQETPTSPQPAPTVTVVKKVTGQKRSKSQDQDVIEQKSPTMASSTVTSSSTTSSKRKATPLKPSTVVNRPADLLNESMETSDDDEDEEVSNIQLDVGEPVTSSSEMKSSPPSERKKMNREERKMEAIMKAFEVMEKREERRKEALARQQSQDGTMATGEKEVVNVSAATTPVKKSRKNSSDTKKNAKRKSVEEKTSQISESESSHMKDESSVTAVKQEQIKSEPVESESTESSKMNLKHEQIEVEEESGENGGVQTNNDRTPSVIIKEELNSSDERPKESTLDSESVKDSTLDKIGNEQTKLKGKRRRQSLPISRRRMSNRAHSVCTDLSTLSNEENSEEVAIVCHAVSMPSTPDPSIPAFRFPKTKKHMMNEWLTGHENGKLNTIGGNSSGVEEEEEQIFVKCINSSRVDNLSHLRRNSQNASNVPILKLPTSHPVSTGGIGSAKKRWLRQAMNETDSGTSSPVLNGSSSPNPHCYSSMNSPSHSPPSDFVTPLKKRRLARESISCEDGALPPTPSTPSTSPVPDTINARTSPVPLPEPAVAMPPTPITPGDNMIDRCARLCYNKDSITNSSLSVCSEQSDKNNVITTAASPLLGGIARNDSNTATLDDSTTKVTPSSSDTSPLKTTTVRAIDAIWNEAQMNLTDCDWTIHSTSQNEAAAASLPRVSSCTSSSNREYDSAKNMCSSSSCNNDYVNDTAVSSCYNIDTRQQEQRVSAKSSDIECDTSSEGINGIPVQSSGDTTTTESRNIVMSSEQMEPVSNSDNKITSIDDDSACTSSSNCNTEEEDTGSNITSSSFTASQGFDVESSTDQSHVDSTSRSPAYSGSNNSRKEVSSSTDLNSNKSSNKSSSSVSTTSAGNKQLLPTSSSVTVAPPLVQPMALPSSSLVLLPVPPLSSPVPPPSMVPPPTAMVPPPMSMVPPPTSMEPPPAMVPPPTSMEPPPAMVPPPTSMVPPPTSMVPPQMSMVPPPMSMVPPPTSMVPPPTSMVPPPPAMVPPPPAMVPPPSSMVPPPLVPSSPLVQMTLVAPPLCSSSETAPTPLTPPAKKKVSLLEYRKRMKHRSSDKSTNHDSTGAPLETSSPPSSSSLVTASSVTMATAAAAISSNSYISTTSSVTSSSSPLVQLQPPLLSNAVTTTSSPPIVTNSTTVVTVPVVATGVSLMPIQLPDHDQSNTTPTKQGSDEKKDPWSTPTLVERIREQSLTGLSDRLKRDLRDFPLPPGGGVQCNSTSPVKSPGAAAAAVNSQKDDKRWIMPTAVEKVREQSLTERLKREFGLDEIPDEAEEEKKEGSGHQLSLPNFQPPQMVMAPQLRPMNPCMPVQHTQNGPHMFKPFQNFQQNQNGPVGYNGPIGANSNFSSPKNPSSLPVNANYLQTAAKASFGMPSTNRFPAQQNYGQNYQMPITAQAGMMKSNYSNMYVGGKPPTGVLPLPPQQGQPPGGVDSGYQRQPYTYNTQGGYQPRPQQQQYNYSQSSSSYYKK